MKRDREWGKRRETEVYAGKVFGVFSPYVKHGFL